MSAPHPSILQAPPADPEPTHIEKSADPTYTLITMHCGASCVLDDDGWPVPAIDWYDEKFGHKATCEPCRAAWSGR